MAHVFRNGRERSWRESPFKHDQNSRQTGRQFQLRRMVSQVVEANAFCYPLAMKKTHQEICRFENEAREYLARREEGWKAQNPESKVRAPSSKWTYAINR